MEIKPSLAFPALMVLISQQDLAMASHWGREHCRATALHALGPLTTKLALFLLPHPLGWGLQPLNLEEVNSCSPNWPVCSHQLLFLCLSFSSW